MTTKELKSILRDNRNVKVTIGNEWVLTRNIDSMAGDTIYIEHTYNVDKWNSFNSDEHNKAIKFFMSKSFILQEIFKNETRCRIRDKYSNKLKKKLKKLF